MKKIHDIIYSTFKKGSKTYFYTSLFFPPEIKKDVFTLYSFVRKIDDFVDSNPPQSDNFYSFKKSYYEALKRSPSDDVIISSFIDLIKKRNFKLEWIDSFFESMELDLKKGVFKNMDEILHYMYGSAEVVGLMMASIMNLDPNSFKYAVLLGRSMQYINFIRDIDEDVNLSRSYLPLQKTKLKTLSREHVEKNSESFKEFINRQIDLYHEWLSEAEKGFTYIPRRYLIPIKTASDMYKWTAEEIRKNPMIVYERKVKPMIIRIIVTLILNAVKI